MRVLARLGGHRKCQNHDRRPMDALFAHHISHNFKRNQQGKANQRREGLVNKEPNNRIMIMLHHTSLVAFLLSLSLFATATLAATDYDIM